RDARIHRRDAERVPRQAAQPALGARPFDADQTLVGDERVAELDIVTAGGAHADRVPGLDDRHSIAAALGSERHRAAEAGALVSLQTGVEEKEAQDRGQGAEVLAPGDAITARDLAGRDLRRAEAGAGLGDAAGHDR